MPAERRMPDKETLTKWILDEGLSRQQIVDRVFEQTGETVTPQAVTMAARRYQIPRQSNRYEDLLPWHVRQEHAHVKEAILLRRLGRRKAGLTNRPEDEKWLDGWLAEMLKKGRPVVAYYPDTEQGFWYVPRVKEDGAGEYDVIRRPDVQEVLDQRDAG